MKHHRKITWLIWFLALTSFQTLHAQTTSSDEAKKKLIEQKIRLVESLMNAPAARIKSGTGSQNQKEAAQLLESGQKSLDQARQSLQGQQYDQATRELDEALKTVTSASRKLSSENTLSDSVQRKNLEDLKSQIATYQHSIDELAKANHKNAPEVANKVRQGVSQAEKLVTANRLGEANKQLADTYRMAVEELSRLREGQEVIMSLKFANAAEEYAYEQKRFESNQIMTDMMIAEGRAGGDKASRVEGLVKEGQKLRQEAEGLAHAGQHKDAVAIMEKASGQLVRALQTMGVPVF